MQNGGCHPVDGCYFPDAALRRRRLPVARRQRRQEGRRRARSCPAPGSRQIAGAKVGFIGMTLEATPTLVNPAGRRERRLQGRGRDGQRAGGRAQEAGRQGDRRAAARGRRTTPAPTTQCIGISDPIATMATQFTPRSTRSSPGTPTTRTSAPSPTRPATRASSRARPPTARWSPRPTSSSTRAAVRSTAAAPPRPTTWCPRALAEGRRPRRRSSPSGTPSPGRSTRRVVGTNAEDIPVTPAATAASRRRWATSWPTPSSAAPRPRERRCPDRPDERRWRAGQPPIAAEVRRGAGRDHLRGGVTTSRRSATSTRARPHRCAARGGARAAVPAGPARGSPRRARARCVRGLHLHLGRHAAGRAAGSSRAR